MVEPADDWLALRRFVMAELGATGKKLRQDTLLERDLGVYGDDAIEFLQSFSRRFGVDVAGFDMARHFSPESDGITRWLRRLARSVKPQDLSLWQLLCAMRLRRLV